MPAMQIFHALKNCRALARSVLAWFIFSIGVAIANPLVQPLESSFVCSASGSMELRIGDDSGTNAPEHTLECIMCLALHAPPSITPRLQAPVAPSLQPLTADTSLHVLFAIGLLPARGPPASL